MNTVIGRYMNKKTWYALIVVLSSTTIVYSMEPTQRITSKQSKQLVEILPELTTLQVRPIPKYGMHSGTSVFDAQKEVAYQQALKSNDPVAVLQDVATPIIFERSDIKDGKSIIRKSSYLFPLAHFARGILLQNFGNLYEAEHEFKEAERAVGQYNSHEEPIAHAAACARFLLSNQYDQAFGQLTQLQKVMERYPCWHSVAALQRQTLVDAEYVPAIAQLAQEGSVDAQFKVVQVACTQALHEQKITAQYSALKLLAPYLESLVQHPEHTQYAQAMIQYLAAAAAHEQKNLAQAADHLIGLIKQTEQDPTCKLVHNLSKQLLDEVAQAGDVRARCYTIAKQLQSTEKKVRRVGIEQAEVLMQELIQAGTAQGIHRFDEFGIYQALETMATNGISTASVLLALWDCNQLLTFNFKDANVDYIKTLHQKVKLYAQIGRKDTKKQTALLELVIQYCEGVIAFYDARNAVAAQHLICVVDSNANNNTFECALRDKAGEYLVELAKRGDWHARCRHLAHCVHKDGNSLSAQTIEQCCQLGAEFLERAPEKLFKQQCGAELLLNLKDVAEFGDAQAQYLLSRFIFRVLHVGNQDVGLDIGENKQLLEAFKYAAGASKAGVADAKPWVKALMLYRGAHGLIAQKKDDLAVEQLFQLLSFADVPAQEKVLCQAFARYQLIKLARAGQTQAGGWYMAQLLASNDLEGMQECLTTCDRIFAGFLEYDVDSISAERWQKALEPIRINNITAQLIKVAQDHEHDQVRAHAAHVLSKGCLLQSMIPYQFFTTELSPEALLQSSVSYAKKGCELATKATMAEDKKQLGKAYYALAHHYLTVTSLVDVTQRDQTCTNLHKATELFLEGTKLQDPACIRALAGIELERGVPIERHEFDAQIAKLERAYKLGDIPAGVILAEHYFDGRSNPFSCGFALDQDIRKALDLVSEVGLIYPQTKRIFGYFDICSRSKDPKNKGKQLDISASVQLLMQAAHEGQGMAYAHLRDVCLSPVCTELQQKKIVEFFHNRSEQNICEALCALGTVMLRADNCQDHIEPARKYFTRAVQLSNGTFGHQELTHLYTYFNIDGKKDLLKAADHCLAMLQATKGSSVTARENGDLITKVLDLLNTYKGPEEYKQAVSERFKLLQAALETVGVFVIQQDTLPQVTQPATQAVSSCQEQQGMQALVAIDNRLADMSSADAQDILKDPLAIKALEAAAQENIPLAHYLMSKVCVQFGRIGKDATGHSIDKTSLFAQAVSHAGKAVITDTKNKQFIKQYGAAYASLLTYCASTLIPGAPMSQSMQQEVLASVEKGLNASKMEGVLTADAECIEKEALICIHGLALRGCVPAFEMFLATHLRAVNGDLQDEALQVIYTCCHALGTQSKAIDKASGMVQVIKKHIDYVKELADSNKNGHAALVMSGWYAIQYDHCAGQSAAMDGTKEALDRVYEYATKAKDWGCAEAISVWSMLRLSRPEMMPLDDFNTALAALEQTAETNIPTAELLIRLYQGQCGALPCGHKVTPDRDHAKKIAFMVKDSSALALTTLLLIAQEDGDQEAAATYKQELKSRGIDKFIEKE